MAEPRSPRPVGRRPMNQMFFSHPARATILDAARSLRSPPPRRRDPLARDRRGDGWHWMSDRSLSRLIHVAAETGQRFARDELDGDPVGWMYRPLRLFNGIAPVSACADRRGFATAVMLHSFWPTLDAEAVAIEELLQPAHQSRRDVGGAGAAD